MKRYIRPNRNFILFTGLILLPSCTLFDNFEKEVKVDLPPFQSRLVVEAYIKDTSFINVALMETKDYFSPPELPFINDATVTITHGASVETLRDTFYIGPTQKVHNYFSRRRYTFREGDLITLSAQDKKERAVTAETRWISPVKIDSVRQFFDSRGKAQLLVHFTDPPGETFYRFRIRYNMRGTPEDDHLEMDFYARDYVFDGKASAFGTSFRFDRGDTLQVNLYTLTPEYFDFLNTANAAASANGNPFAQPAAIRSNVKGGTGIFTVLPYDEEIVEIR